jgi:hypothetical protein
MERIDPVKHRLWLVVVLELLVGAALLVVNLTRYEQGPVLIELGHQHGIHLADAILGALMLAIPLITRPKPKT